MKTSSHSRALPFASILFLFLMAGLAAAETPDALTWLREHRDRWPAEITLAEEADFPVVLNGRVAGSAKVPAGTAVQLIALDGAAAEVAYRGGRLRLPIAATDLLRRAEDALSAAAAAAAAATQPQPAAAPAAPRPQVAESAGAPVQTIDSIRNRMISLDGVKELHLTGRGDPMPGSSIRFNSPDAWLFLKNVEPSKVASSFLSRMSVQGSRATLDGNVRVVPYGEGSVVIPHPPDFEAMTVFSGESLTGSSKELKCHVAYDDGRLGQMKKSIRSFRLKRGYMATIAQEENGSGVSRNYVAQDHDVEIKALPPELDRNVRFVRIFPWRWTSKKGVAGDIWKDLNVGWFYNWNISAESSLDVEYVPIKQKRWWPGLDHDWKKRGATHLLGFNEPDRPDQAKMTVDEAIEAWPELLATGLRLGSPAPSDGGLGWLYQFMNKADEAKLRVDFVVVHYYRAVDPKDEKAAASQFHRFLKEIHDRVKRPLWITEWNNGANWTKAGDPTPAQQKAAIAEMIKMLDETPFVERYALYNWVEEVRELVRKDGSLTPAGEVYRDKESPPFHRQQKY